MKDKLLVYKLKMILKQRNNLIKNLILIMELNQVKVHLVKLKNVLVNLIITYMLLNKYQIEKVLQIFKKLELSNKFKKVNKVIIQYNIMIFDIGKKIYKSKFMNILQLKWMQYNLIQKRIYHNKF